MSARVLFAVPNALDTRRPLPLPFGPTIPQFLIGLFWLFGCLGVTGADMWAGRDIVSDLMTFSLLCLTALMVITVKIGNHMLPYWLWRMNCTTVLRVIGRLSWGLMYDANAWREIIGVKRKGTVVLSATWAGVLYWNARVLKDGVLDVSGVPLLPTIARMWVALLLAVFKGGGAPYRALFDVGESMLADMEDGDSQSRLMRIRSAFWFRLRQQAIAYSVVKPLDPERIAYCAGPEEQEARKLARGELPGQETGLSERHNYLSISGATQWLLRRNVKHARAVLANAGRGTRQLSSPELQQLLDEEVGKGPMEIGPDFVKVASRAVCSFLIHGLERNVPLDWLLALLDGSIPRARVALVQRPLASGGPFGALSRLMWHTMQWRAASLGFDDNQYTNAIADAERVQAEIREPSGLLHRYGLVLTVPESHREEAEQTLDSQYVTYGGYHSAWQRQHLVARGTVPGYDGPVNWASTDSAGLALCTPWSGGELWRPPIDGKPTPILVGHGLATGSIVGWYPFDRRDTAGQEAWNCFVWGMMGDGKTTILQMLGRRIAMPHKNHYLYDMKPRVLVIDHKPDMEYYGLIHDLDGEYIVADSWDSVRGVNVDQRALGINLSKIHPRDRGKFAYDLLRQLMDRLGERPVSEPWPGMLIVDELHMLALTEDGRWMISESGKMARSMFLCVGYGTQDMDDVLRRDETSGVGTDGLVAASIKNASCRIALRQPPLSRRVLRERLGLSEAECDFLIYMGGEDGGEARSSRGRCLVWAHGRKVPTQIVPLGREREIFAMDPQVRMSLLGVDGHMPERNGHVARADGADGALGELLDTDAWRSLRSRSGSVGFRRTGYRRRRPR